MPTIAKLSVLAGSLILAFAACASPGPPRRSECIGQGKITIVEGRRVIGDLACAGVCSDGTACKPQTNAAKDRQWCGCPKEPEPEECHLVKLKLPSGDWAFDCDDPCPQPQDMCTPQTRRVDKNTLVVSCECLTPGD